MQISQRGTVYSGKYEPTRSSCTFPSICVLPSGRWIAGFRASPQKQALHGQHVCLSWSDDEGQTWSHPRAPFIPPLVDDRQGSFRTVHITVLRDGRLIAAVAWVDQSHPDSPYFDPETEGLLDTKIFIAYSDENGETWSTPQVMDTFPFQVPTPTTGPILNVDNDQLACQFELNKHVGDPNTWRHSSVLMFSYDGGVSWPEHTVVSRDPANRYFYWDQRPAVIQNGTILDLFWTYDNQQATYLPIHARQSTDHGRTWSGFWDTGVPGQPAPPVPIGDQSLVMIYVDRTNIPTIKAVISEDGGHTWLGEELNIYEPDGVSQTEQKTSMQDAWAEMSAFSVGLPATALLPDGDILVVYYAGAQTDRTAIEWVRLQLK